MKTIKIYSAQDDTGMYHEGNRLQGTYAHGELETQLGYDIFCFSEKLDLSPGQYSFKVFERPATLFLWRGDRYAKWRGFLIYDTDKDYQWARDKYLTQDKFL